MLFAHNLAGDAREIRFSLQGERGMEVLLVNLLSEAHSRADKDGHHTLILEPYGYRWFRIGGLDYLLKRSDI